MCSYDPDCVIHHPKLLELSMVVVKNSFSCHCHCWCCCCYYCCCHHSFFGSPSPRDLIPIKDKVLVNHQEDNLPSHQQQQRDHQYGWWVPVLRVVVEDSDIR